ncbi:MAG: hypothetical protein B7X50_07950 [Alishewanella sp. 34-51-39]|nr:MAG: hypothetical protein B7X50_07950 [Alishewanella sp. 34-51-39]
MNNVTPSVVLKQLIGTHTNGFGICKDFENACGKDLDIFMRYWDISYVDWPGFSGSLAYPVKGVGMHLDPYNDARVTYHQTPNKWDRRTKYGKARYDLLYWLIEQFEAKGA